MSSPHGPNQLPYPGYEPGAKTAADPYGAKPIELPQPDHEASHQFNTLRSQDGAPVSTSRAADKVRDRAENHKQMGHEYPMKPLTGVIEMGRIALKGENRQGEQASVAKRVAAGAGALILGIPGLVVGGLGGVFVTLPARGLVNKARRYEGTFDRVIPREGEAPRQRKGHPQVVAQKQQGRQQQTGQPQPQRRQPRPSSKKKRRP